MPVYPLNNYILRYDLTQNRPWIIVQFTKSGSASNYNFFPPKEDALYLAEMLRNEKPIYYVEGSSGAKWLTTENEEVGEEES
jgi:hypothetical protein